MNGAVQSLVAEYRGIRQRVGSDALACGRTVSLLLTQRGHEIAGELRRLGFDGPNDPRLLATPSEARR